MIGRDENQEEVMLKVVDKRKFNPDGSLKEGVVIEPQPAVQGEAGAAAAELGVVEVDAVEGG